MAHGDTQMLPAPRTRRAGRVIPSDPLALLHTSDVQRLVGVSRVALWRWTLAGRFPPPDRLLPGRRKAWRRSTVEAWLQESAQ